MNLARVKELHAAMLAGSARQEDLTELCRLLPEVIDAAEQWHATTPAVVAYIIRDGLLLSVTRKDTGQHAVPGGKVEDGESLAEALCREVYEETGLLVETWELVYVGTHSSGRTVCAYRVTVSGEPVAREPGTSVAWVTADEIANGFGAEYHREALRALGASLIPAQAI